MLQRPLHPAHVHHALGCRAALGIERLAQIAEHVIVEQRVAGSGIAGDQDIRAIDVGDVGDAADINHDDRAFALQRLRQRAVVDRHERRALPAGVDVGRAEIMHDRDVDRFRKRRAIADLHGHLLRRPVQHGLAVESDDIDVFAGDVVMRGEGRDGFGMRQRDGALGLAQRTRPRLAVRQVDGFHQGLAQQAALLFGIGPVAGGAERPDLPAVGFDQGDVDPVE